ncbi:MAG: IS3 family transposase [Bacillota bacterium]
MKAVCEALGFARSGFYAWRHGAVLPGGRQRRSRPGTVSGEVLLAAIQEIIGRCPFSGEGHRKVWARLRRERGIFVSPKRVLQVMRENNLLAPHSNRRHDGTIIPEAPNRLWGTDATRVETEVDGWDWVFVCVDHFSLEAWGEAFK